VKSHTSDYGLYIHIPWCIKKCPYCDFNSHQKNQTYDEVNYVKALIRDLQIEAPRVKGRKLSSIFFGGGTPSLFSADSIQAILTAVNQQLEIADEIEVTLEANPGTAEADKFSGFFAAGINRLSIGVQSFNDQHLQVLGRIHNSDQAHTAIQFAQQAGFKRINLDLMFGLPKQTIQQALSDVENALAYKTGHLSYYQLTLEKNTLFYKQPPLLPNDDKLWEMQNECQKAINSQLTQYEISAYSSPQQQSKHNLNYWNFGDYLAIGAGAHGKLTDTQGNISRRWKHKQPQQYMQTAGTENCIGGSEIITANALPFEFMLNALRLKQGFTDQQYQKTTGLSIQGISATINQLKNKGLLHSTGEYTRCTDLGWNFLNETLEAFLPKETWQPPKLRIK